MSLITIVKLIILTLLQVSADCGDEQCCTDLVNQCNKKFTTMCAHKNYIIKNCCNLKMFSSPTGVYKIRKEKFDTADVFCDMETAGGGWIVIQRNRKDSTLSFNRNWDSYEIGFGDLKNDFWYGLKGISCLTDTGQWEM